MKNIDSNQIIHMIGTIENHLTREQFIAFLEELKNSKSSSEYLKILQDKYDWCIR